MDKQLFTEDIIKHTWLPLLLDAYDVVDKGIDSAITKFSKKKKTTLACHKGCANCCKTHKDIPVYPLELVGIYWYAIEKIDEPIRSILKEQLRNYKGEVRCPFVINSSCSIHLMRPIACRQFNVFGKACDVDEDPFYTRINDVLPQQKDVINKAFAIMLPFYGVTGEEEIRSFLKHNLIHTQVKVLQSLQWHKLALRMDDMNL